MTEFVNMFKNYANFTARTTCRGFWMAFLFLILIGLALGIVEAQLGLNQAYEIAPNFTLNVSGPISGIYGLAILIPGIAIEVRRLRDAGKRWTWLFFSLIPLVGGIILIVFLAKPSVPDDGVPVV